MARHVPRVYLSQPLQAGANIQIEGDTAHHLLRVLRIKPGAPLTLFNGQGGEYQATVIQAERHSLQVDIRKHIDVNRESPLHITLLQGIARGEHMDYAIGKAVELGVNCIQPLQLARSQGMDAKRLTKKQHHWQAIAQSAAEQSGRCQVPEVKEACGLSDWLAIDQDFDARLMLHLGESASDWRELSAPASIALLVGPEGGLDEEEAALAQEYGFSAVSLGPRILRTETAAMAAVGLMQAWWGDLVGSE